MGGCLHGVWCMQVLSAFASAGYCHTLLNTQHAETCGETLAVLVAAGARSVPLSCIQYRNVDLQGKPMGERVHIPYRWFKHTCPISAWWWKWMTTGE